MARIVFFGSPSEAIPVLSALAHSQHLVAAVFSRPDAVAGRSKVPQPTPVKAAAIEMGIPVETPASLRSEPTQKLLAAYNAEAFVVAAYGRILPADVLALPPLGTLNIHPSLLPRHRGPSPVASAILEGDATTGVTIMLLDEGMDTGPILAQSEPVPIRQNDTAATLTSKLFHTGASLLLEVLDKWQRREIIPAAQDESRATVTKLLERGDGRVDWNLPAERIERMSRAYDPWPGTFTTWDGQTLKLLQVRVSTPASQRTPEHAPVAGLVTSRDEGLAVGCGHGMLFVDRLQIEGRKPVTAAEFLRGYPRIVGAVLGQ